MVPWCSISGNTEYENQTLAVLPESWVPVRYHEWGVDRQHSEKHSMGETRGDTRRLRLELAKVYTLITFDRKLSKAWNKSQTIACDEANSWYLFEKLPIEGYQDLTPIKLQKTSGCLFPKYETLIIIAVRESKTVDGA